MALSLTTISASCQSGSDSTAGPSFGTEPERVVRPGVTRIDPGGLPEGGSEGVLYVPVYSHVYTSDVARPFLLAVTLAVRNTDPVSPRFLTSVRYFDSDGRLVRDYVPKPLRIAPMAAAEFFVAQSDTHGGSSASFLVTWRAGSAGSQGPLAEAVMVGTATNQVVSFTSQGRPAAGVPR
ncbi:MAG: DUF3124 domain-containing protein [Isosphaeraceae bacterium]